MFGEPFGNASVGLGSPSPSTVISFDTLSRYLPSSFVLMRYGGSCQAINGRTASTGYISQVDEQYLNYNSGTGNLPDGISKTASSTTTYYCSYGASTRTVISVPI